MTFIIKIYCKNMTFDTSIYFESVIYYYWKFKLNSRMEDSYWRCLWQYPFTGNHLRTFALTFGDYEYTVSQGKATITKYARNGVIVINLLLI